MGNGQGRGAQEWNRQTAYNAERQTPTRQVAAAVQNRNVQNAQRAARSFWDKHPSGLDPVLTADMKDDIAGQSLVFDVVRLRLQTGGKYGDAWWATVEINGQRFGCPFSDNTVRHDLYTEMAAHIDQYGPLPASMRAYDTDMGPGYDLCAPYDTDNVPAEFPTGEEYTDEAPF